MRKFYIREKGIKDSGRSFVPLWAPWSAGSYLWRFLLFLAILLVSLAVLIGLRECSGYVNPSKVYKSPISDNITPGDPGTGGGRPGPIPELPGDDDNRIEPAPDDRRIKDPDIPRYILSDRLNVLLTKESDNTLKNFAQTFKQLYPSSEYGISYYNEKTYFLQLTVPADERDLLRNSLNSQMPDYDFLVFEDEVFEGASSVPSDPGFSDQAASWYFSRVQAYDAWTITTGDPKIKVAIVDGFFDLTHPEFAGKIVSPYSVTRRTDEVHPVSGPYAVIGHGTHVAATAIGLADNSSGLCGIAPECSFIPVSVAFDDCSMTSMSIIEGVMYSILAGADVVNVSLGAAIPEEASDIPIEDQIEIIDNFMVRLEGVWDYIVDIAEKYNCIIVWAAGNSDVLSGLDSSKRSQETIIVSAVDQKSRKAKFSNFGKNINGKTYSTVSAPGVDIVSAVPVPAGEEDAYMLMSGTSMAAPVVTGAVALMKSLDKSLSATEVIRILQQTGLPLGDDVGNLIQINDALKALKGMYMNYDEALGQPKSIIGVWESSVPLINSRTKVPIQLLMIFESESEGAIYIREKDSGNEYMADLKVMRKNGEFGLKQSTPAYRINPENKNDYYNLADFNCTPDADTTLRCTAVYPDSQEVTFNLRRVKTE